MRTSRVHAFAVLLIAALALAGCGGSDSPIRAAPRTVINVDAMQYGFDYPTDPAPTLGQIVAPFSDAAGGALNQLTLGPGTYTISNAVGLAGANPSFTAWRFNGGNNWVWSVVIVDDATKKVVLYGEAGGIQSSQDAVASQAAVQAFSASFSLATTTVLDFMIRDYYLADNAGGVSVAIDEVTP